jgi:hypothetical protein
MGDHDIPESSENAPAVVLKTIEMVAQNCAACAASSGDMSIDAR